MTGGFFEMFEHKRALMIGWGLVLFQQVLFARFGTVILLIRRPHAFPGATSRWSHSVVATVRT